MFTRHRPTIVPYGFACAYHDQACAVYHGTEHAVYHLNSNTFQPSWKAQADGWHLVHATTRLQRFVLRHVFGVQP